MKFDKYGIAKTFKFESLSDRSSYFATQAQLNANLRAQAQMIEQWKNVLYEHEIQ